MIKLLIGGSPCTFWSIAQKNGRETEAQGLGWELFKNYLVANVKYFAYEIDKYAKQVSMSNYPDIIQMGDAFDLRHPDWTIGY